MEEYLQFKITFPTVCSQYNMVLTIRRDTIIIYLLLKGFLLLPFFPLDRLILPWWIHYYDIELLSCYKRDNNHNNYVHLQRHEY